jgi:hypothetical protein
VNTSPFGPIYGRGVRVIYSNAFPKPRPLKFRFSGGVNETLRELDEWRLAEWRKSLRIIRDTRTGTLIVPAGLRAEFEAALAKAGAP